MAGKLPSASRGRGRAPMAEINVTPLVDVMLVLLIIFMVTAPLLTTGVPVNLPKSKAGALKQDKEPVTVSIEKSGQIFIDKDEVTEDALADRLAALAKGEPPQVYLRADRGLDYGAVMHVLGELNRAGLNKVALVSVGDQK
ncbi:putative ExbD/TolR family membrane protein [Sphingomonas changbaiensis NBRC 104936]|uniref:Putative ExbD/TolR family membrane protein n=1 Tax=Sphingomonas changbaiensis NBRC 104936 TaxID=1219043 RepID=A0A0E9MR84_9SPHN|nr:protein TolR [Sphingomonas changbaiensis]GAO39983.1 putative ExbD/TolR family membrane protein [Sphingomonas changbaiensis NBRC 104936]